MVSAVQGLSQDYEQGRQPLTCQQLSMFAIYETCGHLSSSEQC